MASIAGCISKSREEVLVVVKNEGRERIVIIRAEGKRVWCLW
jgi:hypothetical protein